MKKSKLKEIESKNKQKGSWTRKINIVKNIFINQSYTLIPIKTPVTGLKMWLSG